MAGVILEHKSPRPCPLPAYCVRARGKVDKRGLRSSRVSFSPVTEPLALAIKIAYTLFVAVLIPIYWINYGPLNFLWFSDIALITSAVAMWVKSPLPASMMAVAVLVPEVVWNVGFFGRLIFGVDVTGLAGYMFDARIPLYLRLLSLFHVFMPAVLVWLVCRRGYDPRALGWQVIVVLAVLPVTYLFTRPTDNINWVFGPGSKPQTAMPPWAYLAVMLVFFPLCIYLPTHLLLLRWMPRSVQR